ncbi:Uncharacterized protein B5E39_1701 [Bacillus cereus]|nr:Uncharacterized protein B5E39_1701 [Bacillus cereus]
MKRKIYKHINVMKIVTIWNEDLIWKVAKYKNKIIDKMLEEEYDYLFFVDSDLVLHPKTLQHLVQLNKDIVAEIFWTKWEKNNVELPQVWLYDHYTLYEHHREEVLEEKEIQRRTLEFLNMLKKPGVYEVGGLGACTLFSRSALEKGVNFSKIKNVTMWGEDRHLSIRAAALGIRLFVDSHFPAYHIYRDSELKGVKNYKQQYRKQMETKVKDYILDTVITVMEMYLDIGISPFEEENRNTSVSKMFLSLLKNQNELQLVTKKSGNFNVCYPQVIAMEHNQNKATVKLELIKSIHIGNDASENLICYVDLIKEDNEWIVNELHLEPQKKEYSSSGAVKKKKITLVYTSNSGSNTIALYKNIPSKVKDKHTIELIRQEMTDEYIQKIVSSDVVVITEGNYFLNKKMFNPQQIIIDLWHGFPMKAMGFVDNSEVNKNRFSKIWDQVNYTTSYSNLYNKVMNQCIKIDPNKYVVTGQPRNDLLFKKESRENLFQVLDKPDQGKNVIFYMPTYRSTSNHRKDGNRSWENLFDFETFNISEFKKFLQEKNCEIIVKLHPAEEYKVRQIIENISGVHLLTDSMLASKGVDLYEVLGATDLLITDYSSVYFDYLLLDKPIIFTPVDYKEYEENRGFLLSPYEEWTPGPKAITQKSLQMKIEEELKNKNQYQKMRRNIKGRVHQYQDANLFKVGFNRKGIIIVVYL